MTMMGIQFSFEDQELCQEDIDYTASFLFQEEDDGDGEGNVGDDQWW